jgi:hypothetical protein
LIDKKNVRKKIWKKEERAQGISCAPISNDFIIQEDENTYQGILFAQIEHLVRC